jgi:alpha-tubulin suppressor-like RCC1 family protein
MALTSTGEVLAWGWNEYGQTNVPSTAQAGSVVAIAAGGSHSMALTNTGKVFAWGRNTDGQTDMPGVGQAGAVVAIAAGAYHSMELLATGEFGLGGRRAHARHAALPSGLVLSVVYELSTLATKASCRAARIACRHHAATSIIARSAQCAPRPVAVPRPAT